MNRKRMRIWVTLLIVLALISGGTVTLISALHALPTPLPPP